MRSGASRSVISTITLRASFYNNRINTVTVDPRSRTPRSVHTGVELDAPFHSNIYGGAPSFFLVKPWHVKPYVYLSRPALSMHMWFWRSICKNHSVYSCASRFLYGSVLSTIALRTAFHESINNNFSKHVLIRYDRVWYSYSSKL